MRLRVWSGADGNAGVATPEDQVSDTINYRYMDAREAAERAARVVDGWTRGEAAKAILAEFLPLLIDPDDEEPLDDDWFIATQWSDSGMYFSKLIDHPTPIELRIGPQDEDGGWTVALNQAEAVDCPKHDDCVCLRDAKTRGDVRRLCAALGLPA